MIEIIGDFWNEIGDAHILTTNGSINSQGRCVMGRGIAQQARNRFPGIDLQLGRLITHNGNRVHHLGAWTRADGITHEIFTFPVKHTWNEKASLNLIRLSVRELVVKVPLAYQKVVMVRPGCGNGRLKWDVVKEELKQILNNRFVVVEKNT